MTDERVEVVQAVVDRVSAYQDGAPDGTVEREFRDALGESDAELSDAEIAAVVAAIEADAGPIDVAEVLAS